MKRLFLILLLGLVVISITGCGCFKARERIVEKIVYKPILPTDDLLVSCTVTPPPDGELYQIQSYTNKEDMLTVYNNAILKDLNKCSMRFNTLQEWSNQQKALYKKDENGPR